ncbi:MAG: GSCFA domain-containing protein [Bacteroidota bacterium]
MEQFRTELPIVPKPMIDHTTSIITTGSCFSDNIGQKLSESKFGVVVNPLGTCYNPLSIHKGLMMTEPDEDLFVESEGVWKHFDFHSKFSAASKDELRNILKSTLIPRSSDVIMITYGTSWVINIK